MDLSKDIMMDLGITVIGDIIAILRHAKQVYRQVGSVILISRYVHVFISNAEWLILIVHDLCTLFFFFAGHVQNGNGSHLLRTDQR